MELYLEIRDGDGSITIDSEICICIWKYWLWSRVNEYDKYTVKYKIGYLAHFVDVHSYEVVVYKVQHRSYGSAEFSAKYAFHSNG